MQTSDWAVIWTKPNLEAKAQDNIAKLGYIPFCPTYQKTISHSRRVSIVSRPLFPRYIFVQNHASGISWYDIRACVGVCGIVGNSEPASLSNEVIEELKHRDTSDYDKSKLPSWAKIGNEVRITDGPFQGHLAKIEELDDRERVRLLFDLLGRSVPIELDLDQIGPV